MDQKDALLFIPDISGFTSFVKNTEILHARHIISELLEIIIDANEIDLEISEIEGDAILFYRFGQAPEMGELLAQVQKMYVNFKAYLKRYESQRICQCGACTTAQHLSLKFVAHYGEIVLEKVKDFTKLFGSDVIVAHRLLKNDLPQKQYLLITDQLLQRKGGVDALKQKAWDDVISGIGEYDSGTSSYNYLALDKLDSMVPEPQIIDFSLPGIDMKIDEYEGVVHAPLNMVFDVVSDLSFRHQWQAGLKDSGNLNGPITKNGSSHRCIIKNDKSDPDFFSHDFKKENDIIRFTESDPIKKIVNIYSLQAIGDQLTRLTIHTYIKPNILKKWVYGTFVRKKLEGIYESTFSNLNEYCASLLAENKQHENQIVL